MVYSYEFKVYGSYALFTDPLTKIGGEKLSYQIPTYQSIKGIIESIYWKPTFIHYVDEVRVVNPIRMESKGVRPITYHDSSNTLATYTYLREVCYEVKGHFEFNRNRPELRNDWNGQKHMSIMRRSIEKGGRRDIFLGTRECQAYVEPVAFGAAPGHYDESGEIHFGSMVHGISYPDETGRNQMEIRLWNPVMKEGVIRFIRPEECRQVRNIREMSMKVFNWDNVEFIDEE